MRTEVDVLKGFTDPKLLQLIDHGHGETGITVVEYVVRRLTDLLQQGLSLKLMRIIKAVAHGLQQLYDTGFVHHGVSAERIYT